MTKYKTGRIQSSASCQSLLSALFILYDAVFFDNIFPAPPSMFFSGASIASSTAVFQVTSFAWYDMYKILHIPFVLFIHFLYLLILSFFAYVHFLFFSLLPVRVLPGFTQVLRLSPSVGPACAIRLNDVK